MKLITPLTRFLRPAAATATLLLTGSLALAHPYASSVSGTNGTGDVSFIMNEAGATVNVVFEDNSTNAMGVLPKGSTNFHLGTHTSFKIICFKAGNGTPTLISTDTDTYSTWNTPRGVAVTKNPAIGVNFGRLAVGNALAGAKPLGLFLLNADQTFVKGPIGSTFYSGSGGSGPYRIRANEDGTFLVCDFSTANACLLQYSADLSSSNLVLSIIGQNQSVAAGIHGDMFGCGIMRGSLAQGNLVLYTFDSGMPAPSDTNCIKGPLTGSGSFNCVFRYNIGSGPLPWNKRPDYAYTYGLDGIAELRTEGDIGKDGKIICGFGRANASNPNMQILRPPLTTNGIAGDPVNKAIQDAARDATNWVYTGGVNPPFNTPPNGSASDPWVGLNGSGSAGGTYCGVRVSPDGLYIASVDINNGATIATLNNGIPNEGTIFGIQNSPNTGNSRGMDWDPADNLWILSSGQGLLRCYSLGLTTTCVTSNDWTGTNGTFNLVLPALQATLAIVNGTASQNYVNNTSNAGAPKPGVFRISLNSSDTTVSGPVTVTFVKSGTALYTNNYSINTNETPNGVTITPTSVIFPAGVFSGSNGLTWNVDVKVTPTALPVSGPTLVFNVRLQGGQNYSATAAINGSIAILNTGPQLVQLSAPAPTTLQNMNRGIPSDQARFVITRLGDTNGPGNDAVNTITARPLQITNINYYGTAQYPLDYTARAQNFTGSAPADGSPGIVIPPGVTNLTAMIGNPVKHVNTSVKATNLTVIINLTNVCNTGTTPGCNTNPTDGNGYTYSVNTTQLTLNEFDNAVGGEVVLWSNPLTNAFDSTNWTVVFGSINQADTNGNRGSPTLPLVISNYNNSANGDGGEYLVAFGQDVLTDPDAGIPIPQSDVMLANGWNTALKLSVNKNPGLAGEAGVNLYPQIPGAPWTGTNYMVFNGNYALRFDMYLSLYDFGRGNGAIGTPAREFAAFGINHYGTNANWRLDVNPRADGTGSRPINSDGEWCTIGASSGSITPADYDMFIPPPFVQPIYGPVAFNTGTNMFGTNDPGCVSACNIMITNIVNTNQQVIPYTPYTFVGTAFTNAYQSPPGFYLGITNVFANAGVPNDQQSANNNAFGGSTQNGVLKNPPFSGINKLGGAPDNAWVSVSMELSQQTNLTLYVARQAIFSSTLTNPVFGVQNVLAPHSGTPMLGYLDPNIDISDYSAFVYFSNMRMVELSPFIPYTNQPVAGLIVTQGASFTLTSGATFASNPLTNTWYQGTTGANRDTGTPTAALATNSYAATNASDSLTVNGIPSGTNYLSVWADQAGSVTGFVSVIEVVPNPVSKTVIAGINTNLTVVPSGNAPPTSYQWMRYGTNLVNSTHFAGVTTATLSITNVTVADSTVYSNVVANAFGSVVVEGTLTVIPPLPPSFTGHVSVTSSNISLAFTSPNTYDAASSFVLLSAGNVLGPYTNTPAAFSLAGGVFTVTTPTNGAPHMFYRLQHLPQY
jgi:hypothetical protein